MTTNQPPQDARAQPPAGMRLVPVEPTPEMIQAGCLSQSTEPFYSYQEWADSHSNAVVEKIRSLIAKDYRDMVEAAPSTPAPDATKPEVRQPLTDDETLRLFATFAASPKTSAFNNKQWFQAGFVMAESIHGIHPANGGAKGTP